MGQPAMRLLRAARPRLSGCMLAHMSVSPTAGKTDTGANDPPCPTRIAPTETRTWASLLHGGGGGQAPLPRTPTPLVDWLHAGAAHMSV
eukprot:COSAG01_NODE_3086_length_6611_cov_12.899109_1_plen_88_part_10